MKRVNNPKNMRIRAGIRAFIGLSLFLVLLVPSFSRNYPVACKILFSVSLLLTLVETWFEYRRRRSRHRMRDLGIMMLALAGVFLFMVGVIYFSDDPDAREGMFYFALFTGIALIISTWALLRWRKLRTEAELRLWQLKTARRKQGGVK